MKKAKREKGKVLVGLSGGVDSSVTAAMLKSQGYEVVGVFLRLWQDRKAEKDAREVCGKLGIPFKIVDARKKFKEKVVKYFLEEYQAGRTPNPCVFCNENLKFKLLFGEAKKIGADWVATGHYARIISNSPNCLISNLACRQAGKITNYKLQKAFDKSKDQSYFLYRLKQRQLAKLILPLGEYKKSEVRKMARKFGLTIAKKKESQDVCFLLDSDTARFLKKNLKLKKGKIIDQNGEVVGEHEGLPLYTVGQRKGIRIGGTGPYYVSGKDLRKNILFVTNKPEDRKLNLKETNLINASWIKEKVKFPFRVLVATRYQQEEVCATIEKHKTKEGTEHSIIFERPKKFIAPGQSAVFYSEEGEVIGGGIIKDSK